MSPPKLACGTHPWSDINLWGTLARNSSAADKVALKRRRPQRPELSLTRLSTGIWCFGFIRNGLEPQPKLRFTVCAATKLRFCMIQAQELPTCSESESELRFLTISVPACFCLFILKGQCTLIDSVMKCTGFSHQATFTPTVPHIHTQSQMHTMLGDMDTIPSCGYTAVVEAWWWTIKVTLKLSRPELFTLIGWSQSSKHPQKRTGVSHNKTHLALGNVTIWLLQWPII